MSRITLVGERVKTVITEEGRIYQIEGEKVKIFEDKDLAKALERLKAYEDAEEGFRANYLPKTPKYAWEYMTLEQVLDLHIELIEEQPNVIRYVEKMIETEFPLLANGNYKKRISEWYKKRLLPF